MKGLIIACLVLLAMAAVTVSATKTADIISAGKLKCGTHFSRKLFGVYDDESSSVIGYDADYCRAIAAVVFAGTSSADTTYSGTNVEWVGIESVDKVSAVVDDRVDVVLRTVTDTLGRRMRANVNFSPPTMIDGQSFLYYTESGVSTLALLDQTQYNYCVDSTSTSFENAQTFLTQASALTFEGESAAFAAFQERKCTVFTADASTLAGFRDADTMSLFTTQFSREPLAAVTSKSDARWSDTVAWTVHALVTAERWGLTQADARALLAASTTPTTTAIIAKIEPTVTTPSLNHAAFRDFYTSDAAPTTASLALLHAVAAVGHYGEIYTRHLEDAIPRAGTRNAAAWLSSSPGLIDAAPFTSTLAAETTSVTTPAERTLASIKTRGTLLCALAHTDSAVADAIFVAESTSSQGTSSMSYALCAALKRGLFAEEGGTSAALATADVVQSTLQSASTKLADGTVDVALLHLTATADIQSDFSFSQPVFFDGVGVLAKDSDTAATLTATSTFTYCVVDDTDAVAVAARYLTSATAVKKSTLAAADTEMNGDGGCTVIVGMRSELLSLRPAQGTYTLADFDVGASVPVCVATRQSDVVWSEYVRWVVNGLIIASQTSPDANAGVTKAAAAAATDATRAARSTEVRRMMGWTTATEAGGAQTTDNFGFGFDTLTADFMNAVIVNHGNLVEIYEAAVTSTTSTLDARHKFWTTDAPTGRYVSPPWNSELVFTTTKTAGWWANVDSTTCSYYNVSSAATNSLLYADETLGRCQDEFDFLLGRGRTVCDEASLTWLFVFEFVTDPVTGKTTERYATNIADISSEGGDVYPTTMATTSTHELSTFEPCDDPAESGATSLLTVSSMTSRLQLIVTTLVAAMCVALCACVL